jgi:hypothetical protein
MKKNQKNISYPAFNYGIISKILKHSYVAFVIGFLALISFNGCKKLIEIKPSASQLLGSEVYKDSTTVQSALIGMYGKIGNNGNPYRFSISTLSGFSADELQYNGTTYDAFINNALLVDNGSVADIWTTSYGEIYVANSIIEGVTYASGISETFKNQALAEAKFMRAFCYFHLVNFFGDVPLILSTDVTKNSVAARTPSADVYSQMIADLKFAQTNLRSDYSMSSNARTRANKWVATALLARVYLYTGNNWTDAETQATAVIGNTTLFSLPTDLTKVFIPTNTEAIWQFYNDANGYTWYANTVLPNQTTKAITYFLNPSLVNAFEANDARKAAWTGTFVGNTATYPAKYKSLALSANAEYYTILRLAEQYLIRAEARAQQNNITGANSAATDVNTIRTRAGLPATTAATKADMLLAIEQERRIEFNCEWGHRWFDLKRTNRANAVLGALKTQAPAIWKPTAALYPIPYGQILVNSNLLQNPGYN